MSRRSLPGAFALAVSLILGGRLVAQNPAGWIQSDQWACLVPLQGNDCSGGGVHVMKTNWVAPHDVTTENPTVGEIWGDIDFGGEAKSAAWRGPGDPTWTNVGAGSDPDVVDWQEYCSDNGLTDNFVMGIAVTYVENTTADSLPVGICTASDDSILVYVNGRPATEITACRDITTDCAEINPAVLVPGVNRITVLAWEGGQSGFGFRLALTKPGSAKYTDLDSEVMALGASDSTGVVDSLPPLTRSYAGSDHLRPSDLHVVTLKSDGGLDAATVYTVSEELRYGDVDTSDISGVSNSGTVEDLFPLPLTPVGEFSDHLRIGDRCGDSTTTTFAPRDNEYTSVAQTGGDVWEGGDHFEFAYSRVQGNFDISICFTDRQHSTGIGRWGKFGLMGRWTLDFNSRYTFIQDHLPDPDLQDPARLAGRTSHLQPAPTPGMYEDLAPETVDLHPLCFRLTRVGNVVRGWASDDPRLASGALDPTNDANWIQVGRSDDWGACAPQAAYVGFANSEHNSGGCAVQSVKFKLLNFTGDEVSGHGAKITWHVTGAVLNGAGVSYTVRGARGRSYAVFGHVAGTKIAGPGELYFQEGGTGPIGPFDNSTDIGDCGPCTAGGLTDEGGGDYTMTASGDDIWTEGDQLHFAYAETLGDFQVEAHFFDFVHPAGGGRWGKTGLMARWDCRPNSAYYFVHNAGSSNFNCTIDGPRDAFRPYSGQKVGNGEPGWLWWQDVFGDERVDEAICSAPLSATPYPYIRNNDVRGDERNLAPWLRLVRRGSSFYSYGSDDGVNWRVFGSFSWPEAPETLLVGVAMTSHAGCAVQQVSFDNFSLGPPERLRTETPGDASLAELRARSGAILLNTDFEEGANLEEPPDWIVHKWGGRTLAGFNPQVVAGRLRLADIRNGVFGSGEDAGTSAFWSQPVDPNGAYLFDWDIYFSYDQERATSGLVPPDPDRPPGEGLTFTILGVGDAERQEHTPVETIAGVGAAGISRRTTVGTARRSDSDTSFGGGLYTTRSGTGRDLWMDGDSFEFAYTPLAGDFDVSVELVDKRFPNLGRWGKFGLMARQTLEHHAKHAMVQDHGPDLQDATRFARRVRHRKVWEVEEPAVAAGPGVEDPNDGSSLAHPRYLRLTRRGDTITGWVSNTAGTRGPAADANWHRLFDDDTWGVGVVDVGFAYSVHNSSGDQSGEVDWAVVNLDGTTGVEPVEDPVPFNLDVRFGERGGGLGWGRMNQTHHAGGGVVLSKDVSLNSLALEFDVWHGGQIENDGDGSNVSGWDPLGGEETTGSGPYHVGLNVNASIHTAQRNHQVGVHDEDLPDIYHPDGLHATVLYDHGRVRAWLQSNALNGTAIKVIDYEIEPLDLNSDQAVVGFTTGTGAATCTMEVDNLVIKRFGGDGPLFVRGDADADGRRNITDGVAVFSFLFTGGATPPCMDAADSNDQGVVNITSGIYILNFLFLGGAPPPPPFPNCGSDPTTEPRNLDCDSFPPCTN